MESKLYSIGAFYRSELEKVFHIPPWQRNYGWREDNVVRFLTDMIKASKRLSENYSHFMSHITCSDIKERNLVQITDGQQRLITIMLTALAIRDVAKVYQNKKTGKYGLKALVDRAENYIFCYMARTGKRMLKITLNRDDEDVLLKLAEEKAPVDAILNSMPKERRVSCHIAHNYKKLYLMVMDYARKGGDLLDLFEAIDNATINVIFCSAEDAQQIYSDMNSTGVPLDAADLVRNYIFARFPVPQQPVVYDKYWLPLEHFVGRTHMVEFLIDTMMILGELNGFAPKDGKMQWNKDTLFSRFILYCETEGMKGNDSVTVGKCVGLLDSLLQFARLYNKNLCFDEDFNFYKASPLQRKLYEIEYILGGQKGNCTILYLLHLQEIGVISVNTLMNALDALLVGQCRAKVIQAFKGQQRSTAFSMMRNLIREVQAGKAATLDDFVWTSMTGGTGVTFIPTDEIVMNFLTVNPQGRGFYRTVSRGKKEFMRYLFYRVNCATGKTPDVDFKQVAVEHIAPPNTPSLWANAKDATKGKNMGDYVDCFGNLALVTKESDSRKFADKAKEYRKSLFPCTKDIGKHKEWTTKDIENQNKVYAELFIKAFPIPDKYKKD
ncbi:DUF262 domain-containing protein [Candidatus Ruminimicrobium bovinum]|uniref:DUF262 domain-containing protein n=1 Tax=Candidatus Ruminimicrobium bovinum TaxID=3242779 RepID=UPI0039B865DB